MMLRTGNYSSVSIDGTVGGLLVGWFVNADCFDYVLDLIE